VYPVTTCLPRPRSPQISNLSEPNYVVRIEGGGGVKKYKSVVKTGKTVVKLKNRVGATGAGGIDHGGDSGEPDHVQARLLGPGLSQSTFVLSSNQARVCGDYDS
jgi:hypothetical protein